MAVSLNANQLGVLTLMSNSLITIFSHVPVIFGMGFFPIHFGWEEMQFMLQIHLFKEIY
jgi:hypothetical protein